MRALTGASGLSTPSRWLWGGAPATPAASAYASASSSAFVPASPAPFTPAAATGGGPRRPPRVPASAACAAPAGGAVTAPGGIGEVEGLRQKVHKLRGLLLCANQEIERLSAARRAP